ncbi:MAG: alpha/beta hydrolase [Selenomonadaceae bacterium]
MHVVDLNKKKIWRWMIVFLGVLAVVINGIGFALGDFLYRETRDLQAHIQAGNAGPPEPLLKQGLMDKAWEDVTVPSRFGYSLRGTYIENPRETDKTILFLHGFGENRAAGINYLDIYLSAGFNVLLVDSRAHGESGGSTVTWGYYEKYDVDTWIDWLSERFPAGEIGIHGRSMGAATALMHAEMNENKKRVAFYIADSAYADFESLLLLQAKEYTSAAAWPKLLLKYADAAAYWHERYMFSRISPVRSVSRVTTPVLYLHGQEDALIPVAMAEKLYQATKGPKELHVFLQTQHAAGIFRDRAGYEKTVREFIRASEQQNTTRYLD